MNTHYPKSVVYAVFSLSVAVPNASATVVLNFDFIDPAGIGFNATGETGASRRMALQNGGRMLADYFAAYDATIEVQVKSSAGGSDTLASAGSESNKSDIETGFANRDDVMLKVLGGSAADPAPNQPDATVEWNFADNDWALGDTVGSTQYDFLSTAVHELAHAFGFINGFGVDGQDLDGAALGAGGGYWAPFDQWIGDRQGVLIDPATLLLDEARWLAAHTGGSGETGLFFHGPRALAANNGRPVNLYSPEVWEEGSSATHLDDTFYDSVDLVMEASTSEGFYPRALSDLEIAMLQDLGYANVARPSPTPPPPPGSAQDGDVLDLILPLLAAVAAGRT